MYSPLASSKALQQPGRGGQPSTLHSFIPRQCTTRYTRVCGRCLQLLAASWSEWAMKRLCFVPNGSLVTFPSSLSLCLYWQTLCYLNDQLRVAQGKRTNKDTCILTYMYIHIRTHIYNRTCVCCAHTRVCAVRTHVCACICACKYVCVCEIERKIGSVCTRVHVCVCLSE